MGQPRMKTVERYEPVGLLAEGGMASVYLAVHHGTGGSRVAAVKVVRRSVAEETEFHEMFASESELALRLNHPNVIHSYEAGGEGTERYLAMEFLAGHSLAAVLRRIRAIFDLDLHVHVLCEVLRALHYVHRLADYDGLCLGLVHRDVNPANIFITYDGTVKLVDFGIAKNERSNLKTTAGVVKGKAAYMAPEQAANLTVDGRADVFAVGILLWEALTRTRLVNPNADASTSMIRRVSGEEPPVTSVAPDADPTLVAICERAMQVVPSQRYSTALEMLEELEGWAVTRPAVVGPRPLAKVITTAFATEKERVETKVREAMAGIRPSERSLPKLFSEPVPGTESGAGGASGSSTMLGPRPRSRLVGVLVALLAVAAVSAALLLALRRGGSGPSAHPNTPPASAAAAADSPQMPAAGPSVSAVSAVAGTAADSAPPPTRSNVRRDNGFRGPPPARPPTPDDAPRKTSRPQRPIDKEDPYE